MTVGELKEILNNYSDSCPIKMGKVWSSGENGDVIDLGNGDGRITIMTEHTEIEANPECPCYNCENAINHRSRKEFSLHDSEEEQNKYFKCNHHCRKGGNDYTFVTYKY